MTKKEYETIQKYEDIVNDAVFEATVESLINWFVETRPLQLNKRDTIKDALKGFKEVRIMIRKSFEIDLDKI